MTVQINKRITISLILILALLYLAYLLSDVLKPLYFALFLAYAFSPLVEKLEDSFLGRIGATLLVVSLFLMIFLMFIIILIPQMVGDLSALMTKVPDLQERAVIFLDNDFRSALINTGFISDEDFEEIRKRVLSSIREYIPQVASGLSSGLAPVLDSTIGIARWLLNLFFIPFFLFFFLLDWKKGVEKVNSLIPKRNRSYFEELSSEIDSTLAKYFRGQMIILIILIMIYSSGLLIIGLETAITLGIMSGFFFLIPYIGPVIAFILCIIFALIQYSTIGQLLGIGFVFLFATQLESWVLTPKITGEGVGLLPWQTVALIVIMGFYFGVIGIALAIPTGAVILILLRRGLLLYQKSKYFTEES